MYVPMKEHAHTQYHLILLTTQALFSCSESNNSLTFYNMISLDFFIDKTEF